MTAYATAEELAIHMGLPDGQWETTAQEARATQLLTDATGVIDEAIGQSILWYTDTVTLDGTGTRTLLLPRWPVTAVLGVVEVDTDGVETALVYRDDYTWSASGVLTRVGGRWPCHDRSVLPTFTAGLQLTPADVKRICRRLAAAGWNNPAGADSESRGDHAVKWRTAGMELTTAEIDTLARYGVRP